MRAAVTDSADEFARHAAALLAADPIANSVLATVLATVRDYVDTKPLFAWASDGAGTVSGLAMRTPPRNLLVSSMPPAAAEAIVAAWIARDPDVPGVAGPEPAAGLVAGAWARAAAVSAKLAIAEATYELDRLLAPRHAPPGGARVATSAEAGLLTAWLLAFCAEAGVSDHGVEAGTILRIADRRLFVWEYEGPVAVCGRSPLIDGVVRIGPVFTPPAERRHGYASALVAAVCESSRAAGAGRCMLHADVANPTSNSIYSALGFRRNGEAAEYAFLTAGDSERPAQGR